MVGTEPAMFWEVMTKYQEPPPATWQMQQGRFRATGMMNHHPQALHRASVAILVTR